eukprot:GHVP01020389.1.p1 GENE.GHVP01020389.1~~GHVP01020389.1.p1  ORF type:complete len:142 (-),score=27.77 GHVP01020389.1:334-729(-)
MTDYKVAPNADQMKLYIFKSTMKASKPLVFYPVIDSSDPQTQKYCIEDDAVQKEYKLIEMNRRKQLRFAAKNKEKSEPAIEELSDASLMLEEVPFRHYIIPEKKEVHLELQKDSENNNLIIPFRRTKDEGK